ncbi:hypothetical protein [Saccharothrix sp. HUAS TT1]
MPKRNVIMSGRDGIEDQPYDDRHGDGGGQSSGGNTGQDSSDDRA